MAVKINDRFSSPRDKLREAARLSPPTTELLRYKERAETDAKALMEIFSVAKGKKELPEGRKSTGEAVGKFMKEKGAYLFNKIKGYVSKRKHEKLDEKEEIDYLTKLTRMLYHYHLVLQMYEKAKGTDDAGLYASVNEALKWTENFISDDYFNEPQAKIKKAYDDRYPFVLAYGRLFGMKEWETSHMGYPEGYGLYKYYEEKIRHFSAEALMVIDDPEARDEDMKEKVLGGTLRYVAEGIANKKIDEEERLLWELKLGITEYLMDVAEDLKKYGGIRSQAVVEELFMHCVFDDAMNKFIAYYKEAYSQIEEECRAVDVPVPANIWSEGEKKLLSRYAGSVRDRINEML